jgi:hypothetical protein
MVLKEVKKCEHLTKVLAGAHQKDHRCCKDRRE